MDKKNPHGHHGHHDHEKHGCNDHTPPNGDHGPVVDPCDQYTPPENHHCEPVYDPCNEVPEITPAHGWLTSPVGRTAFAISRGWLNSGWPASEMEGMKNFPRFTNGNSSADLLWFAGEGGPYRDDIYIFPGVTSPLPDGVIFSGGQTADRRDIVNLPDSELQMTKGYSWPRTQVEADEYLTIHWNHTQPHSTRGYRYFITRDDWDPNRRATREDFEDAPFASIINHAGDPTDVMPTQTIRLPSGKTGHHIILSIWLVADTGAGFYSAFDVEFPDS